MYDDIIKRWTEGAFRPGQYRYDKSKRYESQIVADVGQAPEVNHETRIVLIDYHNPTELFVGFEAMIMRALQNEALLGQYHAEWLLQNQDNIPVDPSARRLHFPGTVWTASPWLFYSTLKRSGRRGGKWKLEWWFFHGGVSHSKNGETVEHDDRLVSIR